MWAAILLLNCEEEEKSKDMSEDIPTCVWGEQYWQTQDFRLGGT